MNLVRLPYFMANKKTTAKPKKRTVAKKQHTPDYYPVQRRIHLGVDGSIPGGQTTVADCGKLLSIQNRRLYRQGMLYEAKIDLNMDSTVGVDSSVDVYVLANIWDVQRAWALAKATYNEAYADELKAQAGQASRWRDFRVSHGLTAADLEPITYDRGTLAVSVENVGEHALSFVDDAGVQKGFTWGQATASLLSMLSEWDNAGTTSTSPSSSSAVAPYGGVNSDELSDIEMANLGSAGNAPPYAQGNTNGIWVKVCTLYKQVGPARPLQRLSTGYFHAPCGLIALVSSAGLGNGNISLEIKSGDYKGVRALSMSQE